MALFKLCNVCKKSFPSAAIPHHLTYCGLVKALIEVAVEPVVESVAEPVVEPVVEVVVEPVVEVVAEPGV